MAWLLFAALAATPAFSSAKTTHHGAKSAHHGTRSAHHSAQPAHDSAKPAHDSTKSTHDAASEPTGSHGKHSSHRKGAATASRPRGQQAIDSARVTEIQNALIRVHYLSGEASGRWDELTRAAMQKYQADQGWQTKLMPDARALKKLGLGPDYSNAINAKDASFADPPPLSTLPPEVTAGFAEGSGATK
jgi:hypothetical protein